MTTQAQGNTAQLATLTALASSPLVRQVARALGPEAELHLVGGTVREVLATGASSGDIDCATRLHPDAVRERLAKAGIHCVPTGLRHQTVTAVLSEGTLEITTFRGANMSPEGGVSASTSIEEDLRYRDFTVNAMAFAIDSDRLIDLHGGAEDLHARRIRAVGSPGERFREDPLRVLRMVRFGSARGFTIEEETFRAAAELVPRLAQTSIERVRDELSKTLVADEPARGVSLLQELGVLRLFLPEIEAFVGFEQNEFHKDDLFRHSLEVLEKTPPEIGLRLAALLHDVGKPPSLSFHPETGSRRFFRHESIGADMTREIMKRLRYSSQLTDEVAVLVATHMRPIEAGAGGHRRLLRDTGELFPKWRVLKEADASSCKLDPEDLRSRLLAFDAAIEEIRKGPEVSPLKSLAVNGNDLLALGLKPGPRIGEILRALHERVLDDPALNTKESLLELVPTVSADISGTQRS